jgi:membrane protein implicated in regulation of membrane protease activity
VVVAWLVLGVVLVAIELHHFAFYALFGALGAFAAALVAVFFPSAIAVQALVVVAAALVGILAVRPHVSEALHRRHDTATARGVHGSLVGETVLTLDVVGDARHPGHVRLAGERWLATSGADTPIPAGTAVWVTAVEGTTLTVWPVDGSSGYVDIEALHPPATANEDRAPEEAEGDEA